MEGGSAAALNELFEAQAESTPGAIAVRSSALLLSEFCCDEPAQDLGCAGSLALGASLQCPRKGRFLLGGTLVVRSALAHARLMSPRMRAFMDWMKDALPALA